MTQGPRRNAGGASCRISTIAAYKTILKEVLDSRPSGTRSRLAAALGKNRSFVTQITGPAYPVPIPASHSTSSSTSAISRRRLGGASSRPMRGRIRTG